MIPHQHGAVQRKGCLGAHDPATCMHCDHLPPAVPRRHWKHEAREGFWHVIADTPELMTRLPRQAHYCAVLAYTSGDDGTTGCYRGPLYAEWDGTDPATVLEELRTCLQSLQVEHDPPMEGLRLWHSGGRGYHLTIPPILIGADAGHPQLPRIYAAMTQQLFPPKIAPSLDRGVYSMRKGRMWRLPNRRRSDTGRHKIPLTVREVLHKPYADLEKLTLRPRKGIFWLPEEELPPCPQLVDVYREAKAVIEHAAELSSSRRHDRQSQPLRTGAGVLFYAFQARGWLGDEIEPGKWVAACPWDAGHTKGEPFDTSSVLFAAGDGDVLGWFHCSHMHCQG
ncbi:MAG: hypothetical protein ACREOH_00950, partial [Candidatus Entotheonellia bacterium]